MIEIKEERKLASLIYSLIDLVFQFSNQIPSCHPGKNAAIFSEYESELLTLEPDNAIVKEFRGKAEKRHGSYQDHHKLYLSFKYIYRNTSANFPP